MALLQESEKLALKRSKALRINHLHERYARILWTQDTGRLTYDEKRADPFELTKYLVSDYSTKSLGIFSNNYISNPTVAIGLFSALKHLEEMGYTIRNKKNRDVYYEATKYLNVLGGTYILDYFTSEEIEEKVIKYMKSINCYSPPMLSTNRHRILSIRYWLCQPIGILFCQRNEMLLRKTKAINPITNLAHKQIAASSGFESG